MADSDPSAKAPEPKSITVGRRFSRVEATEYPDGARHQSIDSDLHATRARMRARSVRVLEAEGVPVAGLLAQAPGGSMLRDYVLNNLDRPADSAVGLAARIVELCCTLDAIEETGAAPMREAIRLAMLLGRLDALAKVYRVDQEIREDGLQKAAEAHKRGRTKRPKAPPATDEDRAEWVRLWRTEFNGLSANKAAPLIAAQCGAEGEEDQQRVAQTIRKHLKKQNVITQAGW